MKFVLWLIITVWLAGCASTPKPPIVYNSIEERQRALSAVNVWTASGRIALSSPSEGFSASMDWRQTGADYDVKLSVLLGQRALRVTQQAQVATLQAPGRAPATGNDAELLLLRELGVRVPLAQMAFWIKGLPGNAAQPTYDSGGRVQQLEYTDRDATQWVAKFVSYQRIDDIELPARIDITGRDYKIRLLIKNWKTAVSLKQSSGPSQQPANSPGRLQIPNA